MNVGRRERGGAGGHGGASLLSAPNIVWKKPFSNVWETHMKLSFRLTWAADFILSHLWSVGHKLHDLYQSYSGLLLYTQTCNAVSSKPRLCHVVLCSPAAERRSRTANRLPPATQPCTVALSINGPQQCHFTLKQLQKCWMRGWLELS